MKSLKCGIGLMFLEESWLEISIILTIFSLLKEALSHLTKKEFRFASCTGLRFGPIKADSSVLNFSGLPEKADLVWANITEWMPSKRKIDKTISFFDI
jgi:hypothetical protein